MSDSKNFKLFKKIVLNRFFFLFVDALVVVFSYIIALLLLIDITPSDYISVNSILSLLIPALIISLPIFYIFRFYSNLWEFASLSEASVMFFGVLTSSLLIFIYSRGVLTLPYSKIIYLTACVTEFILLGVSRLGYRYFYMLFSSSPMGKTKSLKPTMIVGAGAAGCLILRELRTNNSMKLYPIVFIDDDSAKHGKRIGGIPVYGDRYAIAAAVKKFGVAQIILALPSASPQNIRELIEICTDTSVDLKILPAMNKLLIDGEVSLAQIRDVDIRDFLSRDEIMLDNNTIHKVIEGKAVLITGGGGSIGSEICRQIANFAPSHIIIFDIYENNAYELEQELALDFKHIKTTVLIGSVRDTERLDYVFSAYRPDVVFHAAAHKHVPLMEESPVEAVKNNVFGTLNAAKAADKYSVSNFVLISTDKAVNPTNVMGATKRIAEMIIQYMNQKSKTRFVAVRFGNVLGSSGSVVPLFKKQIDAGGPIRVTHPDIVRFFMTIPEAVQLVLQACSIADGGEIFILDMGDPVKIDDLARKMITLSGYTPDVDIKIEYTGLRPGEKLYEELLLSEEGISATKHKKIYTAKPVHIDGNFLTAVTDLEKHLQSGNQDIIPQIEALIGHNLQKNY